MTKHLQQAPYWLSAPLSGSRHSLPATSPSLKRACGLFPALYSAAAMFTGSVCVSVTWQQCVKSCAALRYCMFAGRSQLVCTCFSVLQLTHSAPSSAFLLSSNLLSLSRARGAAELVAHTPVEQPWRELYFKTRFRKTNILLFSTGAGGLRWQHTLICSKVAKAQRLSKGGWKCALKKRETVKYI